MRRLLTPLLSAVVLFGSPAARAADDEARMIVLKAVKAHGGEAALSKYKAARSSAKGKINIPAAGEVDFTQEVVVMQPDKFKESMDLSIGGNTIKIVTIANGDKASIEAGGKEVPVTDAIKDALKEAQHAMKAARMAEILKDKAFELSTLGEIKVEGKPAVGVRVSAKGQKDVNLYFNKETGLLAKVERRGTDPNTGKEFTEERIILEYNKPNAEGLLSAKKVLVKRDGEKFMEAEVVDHKVFEAIEDAEFKK